MIKTKNISEQAYLHIRETLLHSDVYVGQKILHNDLGHKLGISHTPLREAMFRLAAEGLLEHENYKGFSISAISLDEAREIYETREVIEPPMAAKAAGAMTPEKSVAFKKILEQYRRLLAEPYDRRRLLIDKKLHMQIAKLAGNKILVQTLNLICDKLIFKSLFEKISPERGQKIVDEHSQILRALDKKDGQKAAELMQKHLLEQKQYVLKNIKYKLSENILRPLAK
ncbi:MAG: GntR family transcriptional regulator [Deltaproteobacteria bacterium]|jgi:DNA-binding GntR family transcriptional regulator|nr:GntR family transcriptional regulator [Deltaproteobacteria bacterium]